MYNRTGNARGWKGLRQEERLTEEVYLKGISPSTSPTPHLNQIFTPDLLLPKGSLAPLCLLPKGSGKSQYILF